MEEPDAELARIVLSAFPGSRVERSEALGGGISARATALDLLLPDGGSRRVVVRRPECATREETRRVVGMEHALLERCAALGLPAPRPLFVDLDAGAVVLEHLEGAPDFAPSNPSAMLEQMAAELARIHEAPVTPELGFLKRRSASLERQLRESPERLDATLGEARIRSVLNELWPWEQRNEDALLHGDFWPGNLLFTEGKLTAVLDWEEAELGDPLAELAVSRLDILWAFGEAAMDEFTDRYRAHRDLDWRNLPRWDLAVALRPMSNLARWASSYPAPPIHRPDVTEATMREGHRRFVQRALGALGHARA